MLITVPNSTGAADGRDGRPDAGRGSVRSGTRIRRVAQDLPTKRHGAHAVQRSSASGRRSSIWRVPYRPLSALRTEDSGTDRCGDISAGRSALSRGLTSRASTRRYAMTTCILQYNPVVRPVSASSGIRPSEGDLRDTRSWIEWGLSGLRAGSSITSLAPSATPTGSGYRRAVGAGAAQSAGSERLVRLDVGDRSLAPAN